MLGKIFGVLGRSGAVPCLVAMISLAACDSGGADEGQPAGPAETGQHQQQDPDDPGPQPIAPEDDGGVTGNGGGAGAVDAYVPPSGTCGDGVVDSQSGEQCDDGNRNEDDGCTTLCDFTCTEDDDTCDDGNPCNGEETCGADHTCAPAAESDTDGEPCGDNASCHEGTCLEHSCGNGVMQGDEVCDDGNQEDQDGCTRQCLFTCVLGDEQTLLNECAPTSTCDDTTHTWVGGDPLPDDTICEGGAGYCRSGVCVRSICGDGQQEPNEQCDLGEQNGDGAPSGCTASCTLFECGDGTIDGDEQCDDGNATDLDGCDSSCRVEPVYRISALAFTRDSAPDFCEFSGNERGGNASASLFSGLIAEALVFNAINDMMTQSFDNGEDNVFFHIMDLDDPSMRSADPLVTIGMSAGTPARDWTSQSSALDFPMLVDVATVDENKRPTATLPGELRAEGGTTKLRTTAPVEVYIESGEFILHLHRAMLSIDVDTVRSPPPDPPQVAASITTPESFGGAASGETEGIMCGAMLLSSFEKIPLTPEFTLLCPGYGYTPCEGDQDPSLDECSSFGDLVMGGCGVLLTPVDPDVDLSDDGINDAFSLVVAYSQRRVQIQGTDEP